MEAVVLISSGRLVVVAGGGTGYQGRNTGRLGEDEPVAVGLLLRSSYNNISVAVTYSHNGLLIVLTSAVPLKNAKMTDDGAELSARDGSVDLMAGQATFNPPEFPGVKGYPQVKLL